MKIALARQTEAARALCGALVDEVWPDDVSQVDVEAIVATLEWLGELRDEVIDLWKELKGLPARPIRPEDLERLRNHPAVKAVLEKFPDATIG